MSQDNQKKYAETPHGHCVAGGIDAPENPVASLEGSSEAAGNDAQAVSQAPEAGNPHATAPLEGVASGKSNGGLECASPSGVPAEACGTGDSEEPFEGEPEDAFDLAEVIARDERNATLPPKGTSSVATALEQRPPRLAKAKRGPRTNMLEQLIPEVVIPTDALKTMGFAKVRIVEASELEELKKIAEGGQADVAGEQAGKDPEEPLGEPTDGGASGEGAAESERVSKDGAAADGEKRDAGVVVREGRGSSSGRRDSRGEDGKARSARRKKPIFTPFRVALSAILLVVLCTAVAGGLFAWDRWYRYDDSQDILGEWKMTNAERTVVITEKTIKIADNVAYGYTLDTHDKTITYSFGDDSATATYRFSPDRQYLIIDESCETDWLVAMHLKEDKVLEDRDVPQGVSKLSKLSSDTEADPQDTEEIREDEDLWSGGTWVDGYFDYKRPKIQTAEEKEEAEKKKKEEESSSDSDGSDSSDSDDTSDDGGTDEYDDGAAYVDETTGTRYYYDSTQMLYYDMYGNYYYDMYGNNPYTAPAVDDGIYY